MPSHYTLRMQFGPHQDAEEITAQLLDLVRHARADEIMFFFFEARYLSATVIG